MERVYSKIGKAYIKRDIHSIQQHELKRASQAASLLFSNRLD